MSGRRSHRVLVQVADQEIYDEPLSNNISASRPNKFTANVVRSPNQLVIAETAVVNCTTLSLFKKDQQNRTRSTELLCFDGVARTDCDPLVRNELGNLFDSLLIDQQNCCLMNFRPQREGPSSFFNNILVPEIDKRIILLRSTLFLHAITLEYYDVQKYDIVHMFQKSKTGASSGKMTFRNTREFLRWTQNSFINLWATGAEHNCFELEFIFVDAPNELIGIPLGNKQSKTKLSILQFHMSKLDTNMRIGIKNFFDNLDHQNAPRIKQSIITDYLREYFFNQRQPWLILLLFDVPQVNYGGSFVNEILNLAKAAYRGIHNKVSTLHGCLDDVLFMISNENRNIPRQKGGINYPTSFERMESATAHFNFKIPSAKMGHYSLSSWYCYIEQSSFNVVAAMERYYNRKYDLKVQKICNDLKHTTRNIDKDNAATVRTFDDKEFEDDDTLKLYFKQYRDALTAFRVLLQKVERTKYADQLKIFMNSKNEEINAQTRQMKVNLLELCQVRLCNAIKNEMISLKY